MELAILQKSDIFSDIPGDILLQNIVPQGRVQQFTKGQYIIIPQQRIDSISIVLSGKIHILNIFPDGAFSLVSVLSHLDTLGADLVCTRSRISPYHAMAAETSRVISFPADLFLHADSIPDPYRWAVLNRLLMLISHENIKKEYRLAILSQKGLRERLVTYLSMQAKRLQKTAFEIPFSRDELASFLCVNRSSLSHELSLMQQEGLIAYRKNKFTLLPPFPFL